MRPQLSLEDTAKLNEKLKTHPNIVRAYLNAILMVDDWYFIAAQKEACDESMNKFLTQTYGRLRAIAYKNLIQYLNTSQ